MFDEEMDIPAAKNNRLGLLIPSCSVSDPYSFFSDPDPEVEAGYQYGSGSKPDPGL